MSWSEIKKAVNSNIDVPLNELMTGENVGLYWSTNQNAYPLTTVADINTPIIMDYFHIQAPLWQDTSYPTSYFAYHKIKIWIDDEVWCDVTLKPTSGSSSSNTATIYVGDPKNIYYSISGSARYGNIYHDYSYASATYRLEYVDVLADYKPTFEIMGVSGDVSPSALGLAICYHPIEGGIPCSKFKMQLQGVGQTSGSNAPVVRIKYRLRG